MLESALLGQDFVRLTPALKIVNNGIATTTCDYPDNIRVAVIDLLVLDIGRYEGKVPWRKLLSLRPIGATHNGAMAARRVHNGVCVGRQMVLCYRGNVR
jgi:hypothetical protein